MMRLAKKLGLALAATVVCLVLLEGGARLVKGKPLFYWRNFVETRIDVIRSVYPIRYDSMLGWAPKPGDYTDSNYWGKTLTILEEGVRSNGRVSPAPSAPVILAVGDSFTFGSQVADEETWPAALQGLSGRRVINGGVFAYGLDQTVLRAEALVEIFAPDLLVVAFIPDDVHRTERSVRTGAAKPYFEIADGGLVLRNVPVPRHEPSVGAIGAVRRVFGYSYLVDGVMRRLGLDEWWYLGEWDNVREHDDGEAVAALLMERLAALGAARGIPVVVLAQYTTELYEERPRQSGVVIAAARENGLPVVDLYAATRALAEQDPERFRSLYHGHMTAKGNRFVAEALHRFLNQNGLLP